MSFLDQFSASTVVSMEMAKNEIFIYCLFAFEMEIVGYAKICLYLVRLWCYFYFSNFSFECNWVPDTRFPEPFSKA